MATITNDCGAAYYLSVYWNGYYLAYDSQLSENITTIGNINSFLYHYCTYPIIALNILFNVINLIVFTRKSFRNEKTSIGVYFAALAITDIATSLVIFFNYETKYNYLSYGSAVVFYFPDTIQYYSPWIAVIISIDRLISIKSIRLANKLKQLKCQLIIIAVTIFILSLINVYVFVNRLDFQFDVYPYIVIFVPSVLPFSLMCVFNIWSVILLKKMKSNLNIKSYKKENRFLATLIGVNILFLLSYLPSAIFQIMVVLHFTAFTVEKVNSYYFYVESGGSC